MCKRRCSMIHCIDKAGEFLWMLIKSSKPTKIY
jgi:hypothetical protein